MAKILCVLYDDPVDRYPRSYARDAIPTIERYYDGQTTPTPEAIDFEPGVLLGSVSGELGLRPFLEERGHTFVVTSDKDGPDSVFERELEDAEVVISQRMVNHRLIPAAVEPRGVVAHYEPGKELLTVWSSSQNPHILRCVAPPHNSQTARGDVGCLKVRNHDNCSRSNRIGWPPLRRPKCAADSKHPRQIANSSAPRTTTCSRRRRSKQTPHWP